MQQLVKYGPSFSLLQVSLAPGEVLRAEAGTMVARASDVRMQVKLNAGRTAGFFGKLAAIFIALVRKVVGGETFFVNEFSATTPAGWVWLAPPVSGDVVHLPMTGQRLLLTAGAFLASSDQVDLRTRWGGLRGLLAREGAFFIEATGPGSLWMASYGGVDVVECRGSYVVDNGHLVAFDAHLDFRIKSAGGGLMGFVASGEGLVCEFQGEGRIWIQSRNTSSLVRWIAPLLPG